MFLRNFKTLIYFGFTVLVCFGLHFALFKILNLELNPNIFDYSLSKLYLLFSLFSLVIISLLIVIKQKNIDLVGNVFLLISSFKLIGCYLIIRSVAINPAYYQSLEKYNFIGIFMLFLALETIFTIQILNQKD